MAKRYGRNQKRAARQREAELARALHMAEFSLQMQTHAAQTAKQDALERFMNNQGMMRMAVEKISAELGRALGEELYPHAMKLLNYQREKPIKFEIHQSFADFKVEVLQGKIPQLNYAVHLTRLR